MHTRLLVGYGRFGQMGIMGVLAKVWRVNLGT